MGHYLGRQTSSGKTLWPPLQTRSPPPCSSWTTSLSRWYRSFPPGESFSLPPGLCRRHRAERERREERCGLAREGTHKMSLLVKGIVSPWCLSQGCRVSLPCLSLGVSPWVSQGLIAVECFFTVVRRSLPLVSLSLSLSTYLFSIVVVVLCPTKLSQQIEVLLVAQILVPSLKGWERECVCVSSVCLPFKLQRPLPH